MLYNLKIKNLQLIQKAVDKVYVLINNKINS